MKKISLALTGLLALAAFAYSGVSLGAETGADKPKPAAVKKVVKKAAAPSAAEKAKAEVDRAIANEATAKRRLNVAEQALKKTPKSTLAKKAVAVAQKNMDTATNIRLQAEAALKAAQTPPAPVVAAPVAPAAPAATPVGQIYDLVGDVKVAQDGEMSQPAVKGEKLKSGMSFTTGSNSSAKLKFEDGEVVALDQNTSFKIENYRYHPKEMEKSTILFSLLKGGLRAVTGLIGNNNHDAFKLKTPGATIGIRGTELMISLVGDQSFARCLTGGVQVTTTTGQIVTLAAGEIVQLSTTGVVLATGAAAATAATQAGAFTSLNTMSVTIGSTTGAGTGATSTGTATGGTTGTAATGTTATGTAATGTAATAATGAISGTAVAAGVAAVAVVTAVAGGGSSGTTGSTGTVPTQPK